MHKRSCGVQVFQPLFHSTYVRVAVYTCRHADTIRRHDLSIISSQSSPALHAIAAVWVDLNGKDLSLAPDASTE